MKNYINDIEMAALSDAKETLDAVVKIQSQSTIFTTTYGTIKKIPYLHSLYNWPNRNDPLFIDAPAAFVEQILAEHTTITRDFLGLEEKKLDIQKKASVTMLVDYGLPHDLVIMVAKNRSSITFIYQGKTQKWRHESGNTYKHGIKTYKFSRFQEEDLVEDFKKIQADSVKLRKK